MNLRSIMDEKVDVKQENERFCNLLSDYYVTGNHLDELSIIIFRCACNILKKNFGSYRGPEWIIDEALDIVSIILGRIRNRQKWPEGYPIKNLPSVVKFCLFNTVWSPKRKAADTQTLDFNNDVIMALDYSICDAYERAYYNNCSWEDQILDRIEKENEICKEF